MTDKQIENYRKAENFDYNLRLKEMKQGINEYNEWISLKEWKKYQSLVKPDGHQPFTEEDLDILIQNCQEILKQFWIKQRYPLWHSKQFDYITKALTMEASNLLFLLEIKERKRPLENIIHIFQYD